MRDAAEVADTSKRRLLSDADLSGLAKQVVADDASGRAIAQRIDDSQQDAWWAAYEDASREQRRTRHLGEVFVKDRFGERSYPLFETVIPKWGEMTKDIALLVPKMAGWMTQQAMDPDTYTGRAAWDAAELSAKFFTQMGKEMIAAPSPEIKRLEALRDSTDDAEFRKGVTEQIDALWAEQRPLWTLINDVFGDAYGYLDLRNPELFLEKLAYDSPTVVSDIAGLVAIVLSLLKATPAVGALQGSMRARQMAQFSEKALKILDWVDPSSLPFKGLGKGIQGAVGTNSPLMRSPMADQTDRKMQDIARGLGVEDPTQQLPLSQQNPSEAILEREMKERLNPLQSGSAMGRVETGYDAGLTEKERLLAESNVNEMSLDAESAGTRALEAIDETKTETRIEAQAEYQPLREHGEARFSQEFQLESKLQDLIDELRGSGEAVDPDARKAADILESELNQMRRRAEEMDSNLTIDTMSLASLRKLRTTFREAYRNAFLAQDANKVTRIGEGSEEARVYGRISDLLDEAIDDLEARGNLPQGSGEQIKAGDKIWRERAQLEGTPGGELLFKHKDKPGALIDTILNSKQVTTQELENIYALLGDQGTQDLKAGLLNAIFERAKLTDDVMPSVKDRPSPGLLSGALQKVKSGHPDDFLSKMFSPDAAEKLEELAFFMDGLMPAFKMKTGSQTYRALLGAASGRLAAGGSLGYGMYHAIDLATDMLGSGSQERALLTGVAILGSMAGAYGADKIIYSAAARKRILDGLELGPKHKALLDTYMAAAHQKYTKTAETVTRVNTAVEAQLEKRKEGGTADEQDDSNR